MSDECPGCGEPREIMPSWATGDAAYKCGSYYASPEGEPEFCASPTCLETQVERLQAIVVRLWAHPSIQADFAAMNLPDKALTSDALELRDALKALRQAAAAAEEKP